MVALASGAMGLDGSLRIVARLAGATEAMVILALRRDGARSRLQIGSANHSKGLEHAENAVRCGLFHFTRLGAMLPNKKRPWTGEDDQKLLDLVAAGRSKFSITATMKRSTGAVLTRLLSIRLRTNAPRSDVSETPG
jgi:hypothetical protein